MKDTKTILCIIFLMNLSTILFNIDIKAKKELVYPFIHNCCPSFLDKKISLACGTNVIYTTESKASFYKKNEKKNYNS